MALMGWIPRLADHIKIESVGTQTTSKFLVLTDDYIIDATKINYPTHDNFLLKTVNEYGLGIPELLQIERIHNLLKINFKVKFNDQISTERLAVLLARGVIADNRESLTSNGLTLRLVNMCRSVNNGIVPDDLFIDSIKSSYWTFGIHQLKSSKHEYLIGFVDVHDTYGFVCICDDLHKMRCIFAGNGGDISNVLNRFVLIKNHTVITEIYNDTCLEVIECILVDFCDVIVIDSMETINNSFKLFNDAEMMKSTNVLSSFCSHIVFSIILKGTVSIKDLIVYPVVQSSKDFSCDHNF